MRLLFMLILFCGLSGCATATKRYTAEGEAGYEINCGASVSNWGMCYKKAESICGEKGYIIFERIDGTTGSYAKSIPSRKLIIDCKQ